MQNDPDASKEHPIDRWFKRNRPYIFGVTLLLLCLMPVFAYFTLKILITGGHGWLALGLTLSIVGIAVHLGLHIDMLEEARKKLADAKVEPPPLL